MRYRSIRNLNDQVARWATELPRDIEVVVGVPRSGLLAANLLALHRNLPLSDVDGLLTGRLLASGPRYRGAQDRFLDTPRTVLVVDDSIKSGKQLAALRQRIAAADLPHRIRYAAVYAMPGTEGKVDYYCEVVPVPRIFEWNVLHHDFFLPHSCMALEGCLLEEAQPPGDPPQGLAASAPRWLPTQPVGWIATGLPEEHRGAVEQWLEAAGVAYRTLVMAPAGGRTRQGAAGRAHLARAYRASGAVLFLAGSRAQAEAVARRSGKVVFSMEQRVLVEPSALARGRLLGWRAARAARRRLGRLANAPAVPEAPTRAPDPPARTPDPPSGPLT